MTAALPAVAATLEYCHFLITKSIADLQEMQDAETERTRLAWVLSNNIEQLEKINRVIPGVMDSLIAYEGIKPIPSDFAMPKMEPVFPSDFFDVPGSFSDD